MTASPLRKVGHHRHATAQAAASTTVTVAMTLSPDTGHPKGSAYHQATG